METNKTINAGLALADYITGKEYGEIIHYQEIEEITSKKKGENLYYRDISKAKAILESRGKAIAPIGGGDYQVLYPGDYTGAYIREVKLAKKRIDHGGKILDGAPVNDMTAEERMAYNNVHDFHTRMSAQITGSYVEVKRLREKQHPLLTK